MTTLPTPRPLPAPGGGDVRWAIPLALGLLAAFVTLTVTVSRGATDRFDDALLRWVQAHLLPHLARFWEAISWPGYAPQSYGVALFIVLLGGWYGARRGAVLILIAMLASPLGSLIKHLVARPRPTPEQAQVVGQIQRSASFPSGHVISYTVLCGLLILLIRDAPAVAAGRSERSSTGALCGILAAMIALVGPSRVALGDHWPTDVLGGYLLGGALLTLLACRRHAPTPRAGPSEAPE